MKIVVDCHNFHLINVVYYYTFSKNFQMNNEVLNQIFLKLNFIISHQIYFCLKNNESIYKQFDI